MAKRDSAVGLPQKAKPVVVLRTSQSITAHRTMTKFLSTNESSSSDSTLAAGDPARDRAQSVASGSTSTPAQSNLSLQLTFTRVAQYAIIGIQLLRTALATDGQEK